MSRSSRASTSVLVLVAALGLAGCGSSQGPGATPSSAAPSATASSFQAGHADFAAVRALVRTRAHAVLHHDRAAFLATVDGRQPGLLAQQRTLYDNLTAFSLTSLSYAVGDDGLVPGATVGGDPVLRPEMYEHAQIAHVFDAPITNPVDETFVRDDGRWLLGAEEQATDQFAFDAPRERPWYGRRITVASQGAVTVAVDSRDRAAAQPLRRAVSAALAHDAALLHVSAQEPVLVDATSNGLGYEMSTTTGEQAGAVEFAVVATDPLGTTSQGIAGHVIKANPRHVQQLIDDVYTMRHEVTHLLLHRYVGVTPKWATEGIAEVVAFNPSRSTRLPVGTADYYDVLEGDHDIPYSGLFGDHPDADYAIAESAVHFLVATYGLPRFKHFLDRYTHLGGSPYNDQVTPRFLRQEYGLSLAQLDAATWKTLAARPH